VLLEDPRHFRAHIRPQDGRCDLGMIVGGELIADIVNEGRDQQLFIGAIRKSPRCRCNEWPKRLTGYPSSE